MPTVPGRSRPWADHRLAVEGRAWKYRTGGSVAGCAGAVREVELHPQAVQPVGSGRHLGEAAFRGAEAGRRRGEDRLGRFRRLGHRAGASARCGPKRDTGALPNHKNPWFEPPDHAIGRSRGGLTTKLHLVCDGRGRALGMMITGGNINDTTMMTAVLEDIRVPRAGKGRPRTRPTGCSQTRATRRGRTGRGCAGEASQRRFPSGTTRSRTAGRSRAGRSLWRPAEGTLQGPQRRRALLQPAQAVARHRYALRQAPP